MMNFRGRVIFLLMVLATGFSGGVLAQLSFSPSKAIAGSDRTLSGNMINLMGPDGRQRILMGSYHAASEKGQPFIGLSDNLGELRLLFRLAGNKKSVQLNATCNLHKNMKPCYSLIKNALSFPNTHNFCVKKVFLAKTY